MAYNYDEERTAYTAYAWEVKEAITLERIMAIENQLAALSSQNIVDMDNAHDLNERIGRPVAGDPTSSIIEQLRAIRTTAQQASDDAGTALTNAKEGQWAWSQISAVTEFTTGTNGNPVFSKTLLQRLEAIEREHVNQTGTIAGKLSALETEVSGAKTRTWRDGHRSESTSLVERLNVTDQETERLGATISTLQSNYNDASGSSGSLNSRLIYDEGRIEDVEDEISAAHFSQHNQSGRTPGTEGTPGVNAEYTSLDQRFEEDERRINAVTDEVNAAHSSNAYNATYGNIDERFETIESEIKTARGSQNSLNANLVKYNNIENSLTYDDAAGVRVLDAKQGKVLKDSIDALQRSTTQEDNALDARLDTLEENVNGAKITNGATLDARFDNIDGGSKPTRTLPDVITEIGNAHITGVAANLDARFDNIDDGQKPSKTLPEVISILGTGVGTNTTTGAENEKTVGQQLANLRAADNTINTTITNKLGTGIGTGNDGTTGSASAQLDALRARATALEGDVDTIATELLMKNNQGAIVDTNSRLDRLEENTIIMANEIGMLQNEGTVQNMTTAITGNSTRIDNLADRMSAIDNSTNGRMKTAEDNIAIINDKIGTGYDSTNTVKKAIADAITTAANDATSKANAAQAAAEATASADATSKANAAETNAKNYADSKFGDGITTSSTVTAQLAAVNAKFGNDITSSNKVTDAIATAKSEAISAAATDAQSKANTAEQNAKDYADTGLAGKASTQSVTDLDDRLDSIDGGSKLATTNGTLSARVTTLEDKDTIVIPKPQNNSNYTNNLPNIPVAEINANADYLIEADDEKYYYWRYINNTWQLISGAGGSGSGNSNAEDYATYADFIADEKELNKDYYVLQDDGKRHHYRYLSIENNADPVEIGAVINQNNIKQYNLAIRAVEEADTTSSTPGATVVNNYLYLFDFDYGESNAISDTDADERIANNQFVKKILLPAGGGGGSAAVNTMKILRITPRNFTTVRGSELPAVVQFFFTTGEAGERASYSVTFDGEPIEAYTDIQIVSGDPSARPTTWPSGTVPNGYAQFNINEYCQETGDHTIGITIRPESNDSMVATCTWTTRVINFNITSTAPEGAIINVQNNYTINYVPFGAVEKNLNVQIDDQEPTVTNIGTVNGTARSFTIPGGTLTHGSHTIKMWLTTQANGTTLPSDAIVRQYIWYDSTDENTPIIIASPKVNTISSKYNLDAYSEFEIPYSVYYKNGGTYNVEYYTNYGTATQKLINTVELTGNSNTVFTYLPSSEDETTVTIKVSDVTLTIYVQVKAMDSISPVRGAIIDFDPSTLTNNSLNRLQTWKTPTTLYDNIEAWAPYTSYTQNTSRVIYKGYAYKCISSNRDSTWNPEKWEELGAYEYQMTVSDNFNWSNDISGGGYKEDINSETGESDGKCFVIKAGSYMDINYKMFKPIYNEDTNQNENVFDHGAEMKIIFKTKAVRDIKAKWFSNAQTISNIPVGIELFAHEGNLKTDKATQDEQTIEPDENNEIIINGTTYMVWTPNTAYNVDDIVVLLDENDEDNNQIIFKCIKAWDNTHGTFLNAKNKVQTDYWLASGKIDTKVLATNSYLYFPYSEEDKIELDININKHSTTIDNDFIMSYEDGVASKAYSYTYGTGGDGLSHEGTIRIGCNDCDVYLYKLRIYDHNLSTTDILQNFIADGRTVQDKLARYNRNCIYYDPEGGDFTISEDERHKLDPIKLAEKMPNVKILMLETPTFTTGKKDFIQNSTLRCIHASGGTIYESRGDADNWFFQGGFHAGQGTTSDNYGQAGRNVDFLFEVDGSHYPTKKKNMGSYKPSANYVSSVLIGENASKWQKEENSDVYHWVPNREPTETEVCQDWKGDNCKVSLTQDAVPNNYFNLKVNIASSENVNNALFQKRFDNFLTYNSPATEVQKLKHGSNYANLDDVVVKNSMQFVPAVLFVRETGVDGNGDPVARHEFNDDKWHFYALGNIGDSKKTDYTRAYDPDDMNEFTVENSDNNTDNGQFQSGVFLSESRFIVANPTSDKLGEYEEAVTAPSLKEGTLNEYIGTFRATTDTEITTGKTYYYRRHLVETDYPAWSSSIPFNSGEVVVYNYSLYKRVGANQEDGDEWIANEWEAVTYSGWTDTETPFFAPRTNPNPMDYIYPITPSQWNVKLNDTFLNRKHFTLIDQEFDGDHSFEFRYACRGDYRDGDHINDTSEPTGWTDDQDNLILNDDGNPLTYNDVQFDLNHDVVLAFYEWLITATEEQYIREAPLWMVKSAMEFFYAFTHYYTMMDNRAKNTFWHFAKTGVMREVPIGRAFPALFHIYKEKDGNNYVPASGAFDNTKQYYTEYAFDLWAYDMDTALGIDNNGALVFPYGKEDMDYRTDDESSGWAFNGAGSIFWRRLRTTFNSEIVDIMDSLGKTSCFDAQDLIDQFDTFQNCFPEEVWRLDIQRKYIRTFTGESIDNSITVGKQNPRFLTSMMQGRKKYQRRQWIRNQSVYFNSKYRLNDITIDSNSTEFNVITPTNSSSLAVRPSYLLELTPYQDMYLNVAVGNGNYQPQIRAKAGTKYTMDLAKYSSGTFAETRIYIKGSNYLSGIGNLAPMYPYKIDLRVQRIKTIDIGTDETRYVNTNLDELELPTNLPLLETLNIKNCHSLGKLINLSKANNLRTVEASGTIISGISLPEYSSIETLHLPNTVSTLSLYGARYLKDFKIFNNAGVEDYTALTQLNVYDSDYSADYKVNVSDPLPVNWMSIASNIVQRNDTDNLEVKLLKLKYAEISSIDQLAQFLTKKREIERNTEKIVLSGDLYVTGAWSTVEYNIYHDTWKQLNIITIPANQVQRYHVVYRYPDDVYDGAIIYETYLTPEPNSGGYVSLGSDPAYTGTISRSSLVKDSTISHDYIFGEYIDNNYIEWSGWRRLDTNEIVYNNTNIANNVELIAVFNESLRAYPIKWYLHSDDPLPIYTSAAVEYGKDYNGIAPTVYDIKTGSNGVTTSSTYSINANGTTVEYYEIFTGWNHTPTHLDSTVLDDLYEPTAFIINGVWETGRNIPVSTILADATLTPRKLLLLSTYDLGQIKTQNLLTTNQTFDVKMGHDADGGRVLIGENTDYVMSNSNNYANAANFRLLSNLTITPNPYYANDVTPFTEEDGFTLVLDYRFDANAIKGNLTQGSNYVLAGCYGSAGNNSNQGFALYYDKNNDLPRVCFGDLTQSETFTSATYSTIIGDSRTSNNRNIIVIRHPKNSDMLQVYCGLVSDTSTGIIHNNFVLSLRNNLFYRDINWSSLASNAKLCFGEVVVDKTGLGLGNTSRGLGTIYFAKYWNKDLGHDACIRISSWPHETITFGIEQFSGSPQILNGPNNAASTNIIFSALNTSQYGGYVYEEIDRQAYDMFSWQYDSSLYRQIANQRFFNGIPTYLQSLITTTVNQATEAKYSVTVNSQGYTINNHLDSRDYIFIPTKIEAGQVDTNNYEANTAFPWYIADNTEVYTYSGTNFVSTPTQVVKYMNLRFPGIPIKSGKNKIFVIPSDANYDTSNSVYAKITNTTGIFADGESISTTGAIFVNTDGKAYIYANNEQYTKGMPVVYATSGIFACSSGGWVQAVPWWTRTANTKTVNRNKYYYVYTDGVCKESNPQNPGGGYFVYSFGI